VLVAQRLIADGAYGLARTGEQFEGLLDRLALRLDALHLVAHPGGAIPDL